MALGAITHPLHSNYFADAVGELILSRVGVSFLWRCKALRPYGSSPILIRQQHRRSSYDCFIASVCHRLNVPIYTDNQKDFLKVLPAQ